MKRHSKSEAIVHITLKTIAISAGLLAIPHAALAEFAPIKTKSEFVQKVTGKDLTMLGIRLKVDPDGEIRGKAMGWDVSGSWKWSEGYFCRSLNWGGDDIGYNCQAVSSNGSKVRFQSDRGTGQSADLLIR